MVWLAAVAGCGGPSGPGADDGALPEGAWALGDSGLWVTVPRARLMPAMSMGAIYFTVHNRSGHDDRLTGVALAEGGAGAEATLHETIVEDGVSRMRSREGGFPIADGEDLVLAPGGAHVMLMGFGRGEPQGEDEAPADGNDADGENAGGARPAPDDAADPGATAVPVPQQDPPLTLRLRFERGGEHELLIPTTAP